MMNDPILTPTIPKRLQNLNRTLTTPIAHTEKPVSTSTLLQNLRWLARSFNPHCDIAIVEAGGRVTRDGQILLIAEVPDC